MSIKSRADIRAIAIQKEVRFLPHFTQAANLTGIVKDGLLSRRELSGREYTAYPSAYHRLDEKDDAISVSVSRMNKTTFESKRHKSGHTDWVVLVLAADILWTRNCLFSWRNAARKEIKEHPGWRGGPWAFGMMFAGNEEARSGLPACDPTDSEAEVQVLEPIFPEYIIGAVVNNPGAVDWARSVLSGLPGEERAVVVEQF